jgi:hypothetical protein
MSVPKSVSTPCSPPASRCAIKAASKTTMTTRRKLMLTAAASAAATGSGLMPMLGAAQVAPQPSVQPAVPASASPAPLPMLRVSNLNDALRWLDALEKNAQAKSLTAWPLGQVLEHLAQSIEFSVKGFPEMKSAFFRATAGSAAFAYFRARGRMSHGLTEPIPGAPALALKTVTEGVTRLRTSINTFNAHRGEYLPHFAYGSLSRTDYATAHALHIANHLEQITLS